MNLLKEAITDTVFIKKLIPQADPFVMIDKLIYYTPEKIISGLRIQPSLLFVEGKKFQAPGLIENMAQTVALYTGYAYFLQQKKAPEGYIGAISKVNIYKLPAIDEKISTTVHILHDIMGITLVEAQIHTKNVMLASCKMKTALAPE